MTKPTGYIGIDSIQQHDYSVDHVLDIEKVQLPFLSSQVDEIRAWNVLEHLRELKFVMNECWRVLKSGGLFHGCVPVAGSKKDFKDPTHVRHFITQTFQYFTGEHGAFTDRPSHPRYADYGYKPWTLLEDLKIEDDIIYFKMTPRKEVI